MKNIYCGSSDFHRAVKRNKSNVDHVTCNDFTDEFWFWTQKAVWSYTASNCSQREIMKEWLKKQGVKISYAY